MSNPSITNADIAQQLQISNRSLYRKIKQLTGLSPNLYFRHVRLHKAHELLQTGHYDTVKEVIAKVGFIKINYFYQLFKQKYGYAPGEVLEM